MCIYLKLEHLKNDIFHIIYFMIIENIKMFLTINIVIYSDNNYNYLLLFIYLF